MSTIHDSVRTVLGPLVDGRYHATKFPQEPDKPTWPAIRGTVVSRDNQPDQCGAGTDDEDDVRIQIDICAKTYDGCDALRIQARAAMADLGWIRQPGSGDGWDPEAKVHRMRDDFILYQSTPV